MFNLQVRIKLLLKLIINWELPVTLYTVLLSHRKVAQDLLMSQPSQPISADNAVQMLTEDEDDVYFGSYAHFSIHQEMLKVCTNIV